MIKKYSLEIFIDKDKTIVEGVHEKADGLQISDIYLLVGVLEEYKMKLLTTAIARQLISKDKPIIPINKKDN